MAGKLVTTNNGASLYYAMVAKKHELAPKTLLILTPGGPAGSFVGSSCYNWGIFQKSKYAELCEDMIRYLEDEKRFAEYMKVSVGQAGPVYKKRVDNPYWKSDPNFNAIMQNILRSVTYGLPGPDDAGGGRGARPAHPHRHGGARGHGRALAPRPRSRRRTRASKRSTRPAGPSSRERASMFTFRGPALPAQSIRRSEVRQGGDALLRVSYPWRGDAQHRRQLRAKTALGPSAGGRGRARPPAGARLPARLPLHPAHRRPGLGARRLPVLLRDLPEPDAEVRRGAAGLRRLRQLRQAHLRRLLPARRHQQLHLHLRLGRREARAGHGHGAGADLRRSASGASGRACS